MAEQQRYVDTVSNAIHALETVVIDRRLSSRARALWRKVLVHVRRLAGVQLRRGRPGKFNYRDIYALADSGRSKQEIARLLGCSVETVRYALRRVRTCPTPPQDRAQAGRHRDRRSRVGRHDP